MTTASARLQRRTTRTRAAVRAGRPQQLKLLCTLVCALSLSPLVACAEEGAAPDAPLLRAETDTAAIAGANDRAPIVFLPNRAAPDNSFLFDRPRRLAQGGLSQRAPDSAGSAAAPEPWGSRKSYLIPALEIVGFDTALNLFDRAYYGCCEFNSSASSIRRNLRRSWVVDSDTFTVNQIGHPYQGSMYHGFARASGLNYWEGLAYTFLGSAFWEIAGETTPPSKNDQISTGIGGSFLGEALFRMSHLWLEQGRGSKLWREVGAAAISPPVAFNRLAFDKRFDGIFPSNNPEYYSRWQLGVNSATQNHPGTSRELKRNEGVLDFALDYGQPGKSGYTYKRPFDYFAFQASASTAIGVESVMTRGLLFGTAYDMGKRYRGIWGLYGSYDYMAPQIFRLASTAVSLGTTGEWRMSDTLALQGTGLVGVGYATVSTLRGIANERSNHYGVAPQALLALRMIFGDRAALDVTAREYFISDVSAGARGGHDNVVRADASFTYRIHRQHAIAVKYQLSRRDSEFPDLGDRGQRRGTIGIFYTLLGRDRFGTGEWQ